MMSIIQDFINEYRILKAPLIAFLNSSVVTVRREHQCTLLLQHYLKIQGEYVCNVFT